ncbi:helix-turn-helix transcriptional regulator [Clostridium perfringens]|nr:helix-turn-helix transcriptional regulator [Clostridium perfringens]
MVLMNTTDLEKGFKSIYGTTIFAYSRMNKMKKAKELLEDNKLSILEISLAVGYSNGGKFSKAFKETFGMLPTEYRREVKVKRSCRTKN